MSGCNRGPPIASTSACHSVNSTVGLSSDLNCASNLSSLCLSSTSRSLADVRLFARERPSRGFVVGGRVKCVGTRHNDHQELAGMAVLECASLLHHVSRWHGDGTVTNR